MYANGWLKYWFEMDAKLEELRTLAHPHFSLIVTQGAKFFAHCCGKMSLPASSLQKVLCNNCFCKIFGAFYILLRVGTIFAFILLCGGAHPLIKNNFGLESVFGTRQSIACRFLIFHFRSILSEISVDFFVLPQNFGRFRTI